MSIDKDATELQFARIVRFNYLFEPFKSTLHFASCHHRAPIVPFWATLALKMLHLLEGVDGESLPHF